MKIYISGLLCLLAFPMFSQKKVMDHADVTQWKTIQHSQISPNGQFVVYDLAVENFNSSLEVKDKSGASILEHERAQKGQFTFDSKYLLFQVSPSKDSVMDMKRRKVDTKDLPKDSLAIFNLDRRALFKFGNLKSYKIPEKWSGFVAMELEAVNKKSKDSEGSSEASDKKEKKTNKKNGFHLVLMNLSSLQGDTIKYVTNYTFSKFGNRLAYTTTGDENNENAGVFVVDLNSKKSTKVHDVKRATYSHINFSESGKYLGFIADQDTTKVHVKPNELFVWKEGSDKASKVVDNANAPKGYLVSSHENLMFSRDESKLYFGLRKPPVEKDTTLLDEEIVNVEVWTYDEPRLYTVQELELKKDSIKSYTTIFDLKRQKVVQLATEAFPNVELEDHGNAEWALAYTEQPYTLESQWSGMWLRDYALINTKDGKTTPILNAVPSAKLSPKGNYVYGYHEVDSTWFVYNIKKGTKIELTKGMVFADELNDVPLPPSAYGSAGWTTDDKTLLLYDRFDIWMFNPETGKGSKLTNGRNSKKVYRHIKLDKEEESIDPNGTWLLSIFNDETKESGFAQFNPKTNNLQELVFGPYKFGKPKKADNHDALVFTRESFEEFPDLRLTEDDFKTDVRLSDANPQQSEFNWGTIELVHWNSLDGKPMTGMLVKPENFDPNKTYPMLVNFYERSSDNLYKHHTPSFGRSTINYSFYASRGYLIFNPDVTYREGYPGESSLNCVLPGVASLIEKGFVDKDNIGVQGHSWGGYQIAYLVTKTNMFKAAEAGAPVPNMISAYGGIRWWTGLSRQFQYEHGQSRIGGTPWEYPMRYIENSPIFNIDKIHTPLLIMHNDADGHVPWYQGIELFVSLRRLGKPSWFLNYEGEPHWPQKYQNKKDFNIRLAQYFDYFLKGAPKPLWMEKGVPAIEKGVEQGYELLEH
ncbi:alpha/beta hydrolase family protein [Mangrovimonas xylaniphaga]|uniref:alpha/beta hydrolase family protein n=1 Tax=Mangrovimonas xylaniphaga TaxID=1645915 RepID=UPI0006B4C755|nr:prolyl oligopeptidase family serine peptidase [Mangrovimonas xylaniphaga]